MVECRSHRPFQETRGVSDNQSRCGGGKKFEVGDDDDDVLEVEDE
jgi:hypothetical protein